MMNDIQKSALLQFFQAVGQPERVKLLGLLANKPHSVPELAEVLGLKETAVSKHLNRLVQSELITVDSNQFTYAYTLDKNSLDRFQDAILDGDLFEDFATRTKQTYIFNEAITQIPTNEAERNVIVQWLGEKFEPGRQYTAVEVKNIILTHYTRHQLLRSHLLDKGILKHVDEQYWCVPLEKRA